MKLPESTRPKTSFERAASYIATMPPAISGQGGQDALFSVACRLVHGFQLSVDRAVALIEADYNPRCEPEWSSREIRYKCEQALSVDTHREDPGHLVNSQKSDISPSVPPWEKSSGSPSDPDAAETKAKSTLVRADKVLKESVLNRVVNRNPEVLFDCGDDLQKLEIGPGKVTVVGAPPGTGKTSLASQIVFEVLANHSIDVVIANAEMSAETLMLRELSRQSQVSYQKVRFANFNGEEEIRLLQAQDHLSPLVKRIQLMTPPFTSERLIECLGEPGGLVVVDYLQKFRSGPDAMEGIEQVMGHLRWIAASGWAVLALSSTARQQGKKGAHSSDGLDMGSFRGSGEIEFQADSAYVLRDKSGGSSGDRDVDLDCVKNRNGPRETLELRFIASEMRFESPVQKFEEFTEYSQGF